MTKPRPLGDKAQEIVEKVLDELYGHEAIIFNAMSELAQENKPEAVKLLIKLRDENKRAQSILLKLLTNQMDEALKILNEES